MEEYAKEHQEPSEELAYDTVTSESVLMLRRETGDVIHFPGLKTEGHRSDANHQGELQAWF